MSDDKKSWIKALSFNTQQHDMDGFGLGLPKQEEPARNQEGNKRRYLPIGAPGVGVLYRSAGPEEPRTSTDEPRPPTGRFSVDGSNSIASRYSMDSSGSFGSRASVDGAGLSRSRSFHKMDLEHTYSMWSSA